MYMYVENPNRLLAKHIQLGLKSLERCLHKVDVTDSSTQTSSSSDIQSLCFNHWLNGKAVMGLNSKRHSIPIGSGLLFYLPPRFTYPKMVVSSATSKTSTHGMQVRASRRASEQTLSNQLEPSAGL